MLLLLAFFDLLPVGADSGDVEIEWTGKTLESPSAVEFVGSFGGAINAVAVHDQLAYVGVGASLVLLDVGDPTAPVERSRFPLADLALKVQVDETLVYVADAYRGLATIDVQDPAHPALLSNYDTPGIAVDVQVMDGMAYIADGYQGMQIVDVSDPASPQLVGSYVTETGAFVATIQVVGGHYAYLADPNSGLFILDVADAADPVLLQQFEEIRATDMQVVDQLAYLIDSDKGGLSIFDVSDPLDPSLVGSYSHEIESAWHLWVENSVAYVTTYDSLAAVGVSDPAEPVLLDNFFFTDSLTDLSVAGDFVYVSAYSGSLVIVNAADPADLTPVGTYLTLG